MSKQGKAFFDDLKAGKQPSLLETILDGIQSVAPGLSPSKMFDEIGTELSQLANHGRSEAAAALFNGSPFVMYMKGQEGVEQGQEQVKDEPQQQQEQGGREM